MYKSKIVLSLPKKEFEVWLKEHLINLAGGDSYESVFLRKIFSEYMAGMEDKYAFSNPKDSNKYERISFVFTHNNSEVAQHNYPIIDTKHFYENLKVNLGRTAEYVSKTVNSNSNQLWGKLLPSIPPAQTIIIDDPYILSKHRNIRSYIVPILDNLC